MLASLISKTSGRAVVAGCELGKRAHGLGLRQRVGVVPENVGLYEGDTACSNPEYLGRLYHVEVRAYARTRPDTGHFVGRRAG